MTPDFPAAHRITLPEPTTFSGPRDPGITLSVCEASRGPSCVTASVQMGSTAKISGSTSVIAGSRFEQAKLWPTTHQACYQPVCW
jgi:hypothetical protein